jgi:hypothetical protein
MSTTDFTTAFPGTHVTSWTNSEGMDMVTIGIPGTTVSVLWTGDYEDVLTAWDAVEGSSAPRPYDPLFVALDEYMERLPYVVSTHPTFGEASVEANRLRGERTTEERRDGVEYRVVLRTGSSQYHVEHFHNW